MKISESGLIDLEVKKKKDDTHLGNLQVTLDMNQLDSKLPQMIEHINKFKK